MYFDFAATTPLNNEVKDYIISILDDFGNPSSNYSLGDTTKKIIYEARENVYDFIGADKNNSDVIFTSSGSAANTLAISGLLRNLDDYFLYCSPTCHKSMRLCCEHFNHHYLKVYDNGRINTLLLEIKLKDLYYTTPVVCLEVANSEIGVIQDIKYIVELVHEYNGIVIGDFTGYIPTNRLDVQALDIDIATFSAHKLGALKGVGVLYKKKDIELLPIIYGAQEKGLYAGTENVIGIAALGKAVEVYDYSSISSDNRDYVYNKLTKEIKNCYLVGDMENRLPNNLYMCFKGVDGTSLMTLLDMAGIQVSTGSACNSGDKLPSPTLLAIKMNEDDIHNCIRITFNGKETNEDLDRLCNSIKLEVELIRGK